MCEAPQNGSNAKPDDTFAQVVNRIDELESNYLEKFDSKKKACDNKQESTLKDVEAGLYTEFNKPNLDYHRLKTYLECKIIENDTDMKKWMADFLISVIKIVLSVLVGTAALKSLKLDTENLLSGNNLWVIFALIAVAVICIFLGVKVELPIKKQYNQKHFYEICLKILEQYLPTKNEVNNSQNLKCSVKTNTKHKKNKK